MLLYIYLLLGIGFASEAPNDFEDFWPSVVAFIIIALTWPCFIGRGLYHYHKRNLK
jgi:hypothetical protein